MKRRALRYSLGAGVLFTAVGAWLLFHDSQPTTQRLPDGSTVSLLGVTYGRNHVMVYGPFWQRAVARPLPDQAVRRLGIPLFKHTTTNDTLMLWTELRDSPNPSGPPLRVSLSDTSGTEFPQVAPQIWFKGTNNSVQGTLFQIVPRGSRQLRAGVRIGVSPGERILYAPAQFEIPNPAPNHRRTWQAPSFPVQATAGDRTFVLTHLRPWERQETWAPSHTETWMTARYHFREAGAMTTNWRVAKVEIFNEAGGSFVPPYTLRGDVDQTEFEFGCGLGTNEVWKLRFTLSRKDGFAPNEIATIPRLEFPARGSLPSAPITISAAGMTLSVYSEYQQFGPTVVARLNPPDEDVQLTVLRMVDRYGANIRHYPYGSQFKGNYSWTLHPQQEGDYINLTLAVSRLRYVEVLVRPEPPFKYSP